MLHSRVRGISRGVTMAICRMTVIMHVSCTRNTEGGIVEAEAGLGNVPARRIS